MSGWPEGKIVTYLEAPGMYGGDQRYDTPESHGMTRRCASGVSVTAEASWHD